MNELFRKESIDRLSTQEHTGIYTNTTSPAGWLILTAVLIFVISFMVWGFTGKLPVSVKGMGYSHRDDRLCQVFLNPDAFRESNIDEDDTVYLQSPGGVTVNGKVLSISEQPYSADDIISRSEINQWIIQKVLDGNEYCYIINVGTEQKLQADTILEATIIEKTVQPIYFLTNR